MKNKTGLLALLVFVLSGCSIGLPKYLPSPDQLGVNEYGSYISLSMQDGPNLQGELIAIGNDSIIVLEKSTRNCTSMPVSGIKRYSLYYAQPKNYGWAIPLYSLVTISHGWFLAISFPVNLIATTIIYSEGRNAYRYRANEISLESLKMFARFPEGIPAGIDVASIK
ncbi:MAG: hypothetical protein IH597_15660 [Bacteroidales bacterium]|nr:hypothetical protein [Bacteroidales bacterium]